MDNFEELEQKAIEDTKPKKPKMKVTGRSVFLLREQTGVPVSKIKKSK